MKRQYRPWTARMRELWPECKGSINALRKALGLACWTSAKKQLADALAEADVRVPRGAPRLAERRDRA